MEELLSKFNQKIFETVIGEKKFSGEGFVGQWRSVVRSEPSIDGSFFVGVPIFKDDRVADQVLSDGTCESRGQNGIVVDIESFDFLTKTLHFCLLGGAGRLKHTGDQHVVCGHAFDKGTGGAMLLVLSPRIVSLLPADQGDAAAETLAAVLGARLGAVVEASFGQSPGLGQVVLGQVPFAHERLQASRFVAELFVVSVEKGAVGRVAQMLSARVGVRLPASYCHPAAKALHAIGCLWYWSEKEAHLCQP